MCSMIPKLFLIEDNPTLRETMVFSIGAMGGMECCGSAESGEDALEQLGGLEPDVVLVDGSLPGMSGTEFVREIKKLKPSLRCLFFSGRHEREIVEGALKAGACGYVVKGGKPTELQVAVAAVMEGKCYVSPSVEGWEGLQDQAAQDS